MHLNALELKVFEAQIRIKERKFLLGILEIVERKTLADSRDLSTGTPMRRKYLSGVSYGYSQIIRTLEERNIRDDTLIDFKSEEEQRNENKKG